MAKQLNKSIKGDKIDFQVNLNVDKTSLNDLQKSINTNYKFDVDLKKKIFPKIKNIILI